MSDVAIWPGNPFDLDWGGPIWIDVRAFGESEKAATWVCGLLPGGRYTFAEMAGIDRQVAAENQTMIDWIADITAA